MLAVVRTAEVVADTNDAIAAALQSGRSDLAAKAIGEGLGGVLSVLHESLTDPNSSITAALLNARDDLALQVGRADEYDAPTLGSLLSSLQKTAKVSFTNYFTTRAMLQEVRTSEVPEAVEDTEPAAALAAATATEESATEESATGGSATGGEATEDVVTDDDALDDDIAEGSATDEATDDEAALDEATDEATDDEAADAPASSAPDIESCPSRWTHGRQRGAAARRGVAL